MALAVYAFKRDMISLYRRLESVEIPPAQIDGGGSVSIVYDQPLDADQKGQLDQAMLDAGFIPEKEMLLKEARLAELQFTAKNYIFAHYSSERQQTLAILLSEARFGGLNNRANYVAQALGWVDAILAYYYTKQTEIEAAVTNDEIAAVAWDFAQFDGADPAVTIQAARSIPD